MNLKANKFRNWPSESLARRLVRIEREMGDDHDLAVIDWKRAIQEATGDSVNQIGRVVDSKWEEASGGSLYFEVGDIKFRMADHPRESDWHNPSNVSYVWEEGRPRFLTDSRDPSNIKYFSGKEADAQFMRIWKSENGSHDNLESEAIKIITALNEKH